ncbi:MAG: hypothetical protein WCH34_13390 [Bacteroidota bacterium]
MSADAPHLWIALPAMGESESIPQLFQCISEQSYRNFTVVVCVNQPESWHHLPEKQFYCTDNALTLQYLKSFVGFKTLIMDCSSPGKAFSDKQSGVGWARKMVMDEVNKYAAENDLIISVDADTIYYPSYFGEVLKSFKRYPKSIALAVPYYHPITENEGLNRAMLRYEIYMRYYSINLLRIGSPYAYTALGSAIALPVKSYRKVSGISPVKSGEDFYFLQKLVKSGPLLCFTYGKVYPATRLSDRVGFGTGPALIKGIKGEWDSYPIYHPSLFDEVNETYKSFPLLYEGETVTPMSGFLQEIFKEQDIWAPLRKNATTQKQFIRACHQKVDGLRVLQYLKSRQKSLQFSDESSLIEFCKRYQPQLLENFSEDISFNNTSVEMLNELRNNLVDIEAMCQKKHLFLDISKI